VAGNARVDHDIVALDQLELNALDGKITGQLLAELRGLDTQLVFRGKLTGLRAPAPGKASAAGRDPFDANIAIELAPYRYGLEGRAEFVRIGRDHLRALLDVWDPYHADVAANRVRLALLAGYPKQVRLHFASGFATLGIELGGLAGVARIDELRGLPIGPALARYLAPVLEPDHAP
jgi:translocation and assembly module TamB